jgi:hypothetical protein
VPIDSSTQIKLKPLAILCRHASHFNHFIARSGHATSNLSTINPNVWIESRLSFSLHARSKIIVSKDALVEPLVCHSPGPCTAGLAAEQALRTGRLLEHAVFFHGLHFVASGVSEEVLEVFVFEGEGVAGDTCLRIRKVA